MEPWVVVIVVATAIVAVVGVLATVGWVRGWQPRWYRYVRHAWAEAGFRSSLTWSELVDWLRLGR